MSEKIDWAKIKPAEVEALIVELGKKGTTTDKIGLILRDQHGIPKAKLFGLKIGKVLAKHKIVVDGEIKVLEVKIDKLTKHNKHHKHDYMPQRKSVMYAAKLKKMQVLAGK